MIESGTFIDGIHVPAHTRPGAKRGDKPVPVPARTFLAFTLREDRFGDTLEVANNPLTSAKAADSEAYYRAALFAQRLTIEGLDTVTPEMVVELSGADGEILMDAAGRIARRRQEFRNAAQAAEKKAGSAAKAGD